MGFLELRRSVLCPLVMWSDTLLIVGIPVFTALLGEGFTWLLVYRTKKYTRLKTDLEKQTRRLERKKEAVGDSALDRTQKRKLEKDEERLKSTNRDLMMVKMKSMFAIGFVFTSLLSMFNSIFDGKVVAHLPFTPISWVQGISHRNLLGEDFTVFIYIFVYPLYHVHSPKHSKGTRICSIKSCFKTDQHVDT